MVLLIGLRSNLIVVVVVVVDEYSISKSVFCELN